MRDSTVSCRGGDEGPRREEAGSLVVFISRLGFSCVKQEATRTF